MEDKNKGNRRSFDLFGAHAPNFAQDDMALGGCSGGCCFGEMCFDDCEEFG
jgi:hypothetical protein